MSVYAAPLSSITIFHEGEGGPEGHIIEVMVKTSWKLST
jgi:hypothetical protein